MFFLLDKVSNQIITRSEVEIDFGGPWGQWQKEGRAVWFRSDLEADEVKVEDGKVVIDEEKKAANDQAEADKLDRIAMMKDLSKIQDPQAQAVLKAIIDHLGLAV